MKLTECVYMSHSLLMMSWCKSSVCAVYFCPADCSCTLCGASEVTSPASGWWTHSLFCWLLSLCPVSSPASCCFIFYHTTWTDGQSVIAENFPDDCLTFFCGSSLLSSHQVVQVRVWSPFLPVQSWKSLGRLSVCPAGDLAKLYFLLFDNYRYKHQFKQINTIRKSSSQ